jgi:hypothetical protein
VGLWMQRLTAVQQVETGMMVLGGALVVVTLGEAFRRYGLGQARSARSNRILMLILGLLGLLCVGLLLLSPTQALEIWGAVVLGVFATMWCNFGLQWVSFLEFLWQNDFSDQTPEWLVALDQLFFWGCVLLVILTVLFLVLCTLAIPHSFNMD